MRTLHTWQTQIQEKKWVANFSLHLHEPISHKYTQISDKSQLCILKATCLQNERHF